MADRSAVLWTRWGGQPRKVADIVRVGGVESAEVRLTYDGGAPVGVSVFHDPARLRGVTLPFPITEHQPLPPYLEALVPPRTGPLWAYVINRLAKQGITPPPGMADWDVLLAVGRNGIGHLDVFAHDGAAERWYAEDHPRRAVGEEANRRGLWDKFRSLTLATITDEEGDAIQEDVGPTPGVTGMIPKLSVPVLAEWLVSGGTGEVDCIVKVEPPEYPGVLAMEEKCYHIHQAAGCAVPKVWLKATTSGTPLLVSKRFDRIDLGEPVPLESLHGLLRMATVGKVSTNWSDPDGDRSGGRIVPDLHRVAEILKNPMVGVAPKQGEELLRRVALALLTGNSDLHLGNLSVIGTRGDAALSPVYDPAPMRAYARHFMTAALNFGGLQLSRRRAVHPELWEKLIDFGREIGVRRPKAIDVLLACWGATRDWGDFLKSHGQERLAVDLESDDWHFKRTVVAAPRTKTVANVPKPKGR